VAVVLLLVLTAITVSTGAFGGEAAEELHEVIGWVLFAMVALHVAAVIVMSMLDWRRSCWLGPTSSSNMILTRSRYQRRIFQGSRRA
jgi:hypothetical protein